MVDKSEWTTSDFDRTSWHDCSIYGFRLEEREHGTAELEFDVDFIVEWLCHDDLQWEFRVAPATLTFHNVFSLRFELDAERSHHLRKPWIQAEAAAGADPRRSPGFTCGRACRRLTALEPTHPLRVVACRPDA